MKRFLIAGLAGVSVFGAAYGFAAAIDVTSDDFGSGDEVVLSCDSAVNASYTTSWDATDNRYEVTDVKIEGIDDEACAGHKVGVTLSGDSGTPNVVTLVGDGASAVPAADANTTNDNVTVSVAIGESPAAEEVDDVHVVIYDGNSTSAE